MGGRKGEEGKYKEWSISLVQQSPYYSRTTFIHASCIALHLIGIVARLGELRLLDPLNHVQLLVGEGDALPRGLVSDRLPVVWVVHLGQELIQLDKETS